MFVVEGREQYVQPDGELCTGRVVRFLASIQDYTRYCKGTVVVEVVQLVLLYGEMLKQRN